MTDQEYVRRMLADEPENIKRAHEIRAVYARPSQEALALAARARVAAEALM
jgi:hypothetical protein